MSEAAPYVVVDSSVAVKWFLQEEEPNVNAALSILDEHRRGERIIAVPGLLYLEVLNALKHRGLGKPDLASAARALEGLRLESASPVALAESAAVMAVESDLTLYDAAFAALAKRLDVELVTADRKLADSGACRALLLEG